MGENWPDEKTGVGRKVTGSSAPVQGESFACWGVIWGLGWVQRRGRTEDGVDGRKVWLESQNQRMKGRAQSHHLRAWEGF